MIQVLVVEDSRITRDAIESQIAKSERYVLYASIENAANAEIACLRGCVDLILMDVCTADEESGLKAASKIKQYNPKIKIVIPCRSIPLFRKRKRVVVTAFGIRNMVVLP